MAVTYKVKKGDTLSGIAKKYGVSVDAIRLANLSLIKNVNLINVGWVLTIPSGSGSTPPATKQPTKEETDTELKKTFNKVLDDIEKLDSVKKLLALL